MISDSERQKANDYLERKKLRLQQVREQSKMIAKNIRTRVQEEKNKQLRTIGALKSKEFENAKRKTIEKLQKDHASCLCELGASHDAATDEIAAEQEFKVQKEINVLKASARGSVASGALQSMKIQREQNARNTVERREKARSISNKIVANIRKKSQPMEKKIQHYYLENEDPNDNECSNMTENFEVQHVPYLNTLSDNIFSSATKLSEEITPTAVSPKKKKTLGLSAKPTLQVDNASNREGSRSNPAMLSNGYGNRWNAAERDNSFISEDPSMYRLYPVETLRQIAIENNLSQASLVNPKSDLKNTYEYSTDAINEVPTLQSKNVLERLHSNSSENPFNIVSEHIQNRNSTNNDKPSFLAYNKAGLETEPICYSNTAIRDTIEHARTAPYNSSADIAPKIPNLPEYYMKKKSDIHSDIEGNTARQKTGDTGDHRLPKSTETCSTDHLKQRYTALDPELYNQNVNPREATKPLRGILAKCMPCKNTVGNLKRATAGRQNSQRQSGRVMGSERPVRCYDQANKFSKNVSFDSRKIVKRTPRSGINAYRMAKEEELEEDRLIADMKLCKNVTASRLRGENALEKLRFNNEIKKMKREIQQLKNERLFRSQLPETIYVEECPRQHETYCRKNEEHKKADRLRTESTDKQKLKSPNNEMPKESSSEQKYFTSNRAPANKVPKPEKKILSEDLDEIPTRESESSSRSTALERITEITPEEVKNLDAEELFHLVQKQKKKLMKEVLMIGLPYKSKIPKSDDILKEDSSCSMSVEAPPKAANKKFTKRSNVSSPKGKIWSEKLKNKDDNNKVAVDKLKLNKEMSQAGSTTVSSVSFEGLQIVIQIKKDSKKLEKKSFGSVGAAENRPIENVRERVESSNEVSIKTSKYVSKKEGKVEEGTKYDTSESTAYLSPPERITTHFEKLLDHKFTSRSSLIHSRNDTPPTDDTESNVQHWVKAAEGQNRQHYRDMAIMTERRSPEQGEVSTFPKNNKVTQVENKSVQVKLMNEIQKSAVIVECGSISQMSTTSGDPVLKKYIRQLLEMYKTGVDRPAIDVSDVSTPSSSIINIQSNMTGSQGNIAFHEKVEKSKNLIRESYSLLEELGKENIFSSSACGSSKIKDRFRVSTDDVLSSLAANSTENIQKSKVCQVLPQGLTKKLTKDKIPVSKSEPTIDKKCQIVTAEPEKSSIINHAKPNRDQNTNNIKVTNNITYQPTNDEIEECKQKISNLSEMLNQMRNNKKSSSSMSTSPLSEKMVAEISQKLSSNTSDESEKKTVTNSANVAFVPMLGDIPKPRSVDIGRNSQIDQLRTDMLSKSERTDTFVPIVCDCKPMSPMIENLSDSSTSSIGQAFPSCNLDDFKSHQHNNRPKPPVAFGRHPIMRNINVDPGTPHELSTIAEVDTPTTAKNKSAQSKSIELSLSSVMTANPFKIDKMESAKDENETQSVNLQEAVAIVSNVEKSSTEKPDNIFINHQNKVNIPIPAVNNLIDPTIEFKPFISFNEFMTQKYPGEVNAEITVEESTLIPENIEDVDLSSDETLPDIIPEMLKRNLIKKPFSSHNSTTHGSAEESSSSSRSETALLTLSPSKSPLKDLQRWKKKHDPSITGVQVLQNMSSGSDRSSDFEAVLKAKGMGWAIAHIKRTEKAYQLSSSSSSPESKQLPPKKKYSVIPTDPGNISNASVGLSTLLDDLNLDDDFYKDYLAGNISKCSAHRELEMQFEKIEINMKEKEHAEGSLPILSPFTTLSTEEPSFNKRTDVKVVKFAGTNAQGKPDECESSKDKTHQRTSTPVLPTVKSSSLSSNSTCYLQGASKGLFGNESDLSSVRNASNSDRNLSLDDKCSLSIPNHSLKFRKMFDSTTLHSDS